MKWLNNIKDPLTSVLGFAIIGVSVYFMVTGKLSVKWDGLLLCGLGFIFLFLKDAVIKAAMSILSSIPDAVNKWLNKK